MTEEAALADSNSPHIGFVESTAFRRWWFNGVQHPLHRQSLRSLPAHPRFARRGRAFHLVASDIRQSIILGQPLLALLWRGRACEEIEFFCQSSC